MDTTETTLYTAVLISSIIVVFLLFYFAFWMYGNHRKHFSSLREYYLKEVELLESDRSRIARDLHDELGQMLSASQLFIRNSAGITAEDERRLGKAEELIKDVTRRMGEIAKDMRPSVLDEKGLQEALQQLMQQYAFSVNMQFQLDYRLKTQVQGSFALHVYRIVQELLHNAVKHSEASNVVVILLEQKQYMYLYYRDDGKGMPAIPSKSGAGTGNLRSRTLLLNGKVRVNSFSGKGTNYFFTIPLTTNGKQ